MSKEILMQVYNTLTQVEVKGYDNIDKMCGVLYALRAELGRLEEEAQVQSEE